MLKFKSIPIKKLNTAFKLFMYILLSLLKISCFKRVGLFNGYAFAATRIPIKRPTLITDL